MISGLAITDDNYNIAICILRDRYDNASKQTNVLLQRFQTFDKICDIYVTTLKQMETGIQHIVDKLEQAALALGEKANVKQVGVN